MLIYPIYMGIRLEPPNPPLFIALGQTFTLVLLPLNQLSSILAEGCVGVGVGVEAKPPTLGRTVFPPLKLVLVELPLKLPSKNLGNMVAA